VSGEWIVGPQQAFIESAQLEAGGNNLTVVITSNPGNVGSIKFIVARYQQHSGSFVYPPSRRNLKTATAYRFRCPKYVVAIT
jgi:hypothetical protein